ncbi:MAG: hypothetical protein JW703_04760 [Candidatus Diapherotrites archaeon]|nr:hypothetical protein [Candidatus Diapherotrites archaeon]
MEEVILTQTQAKKALKIIERMAGQTEKFKKKHSEIKKESPKPYSIKKYEGLIEDIKIPKLSELKLK